MPLGMDGRRLTDFSHSAVPTGKRTEPGSSAPMPQSRPGPHAGRGGAVHDADPTLGRPVALAPTYQPVGPAARNGAYLMRGGYVEAKLNLQVHRSERADTAARELDRSPHRPADHRPGCAGNHIIALPVDPANGSTLWRRRDRIHNKAFTRRHQRGYWSNGDRPGRQRSRVSG